ncbi:MAG: RNase P modulator RnpM [Actinomycetota bacterium]
MAPHTEPERTCVGCRQAARKLDLIRIVRTPRGEVRVDADGRAPGRGAYVHADRACATAAIARGTLARSLRVGLRADEAARLGNEIEREIERDVRR